MKLTPLTGLMLGLAIAPAAWAQMAGEPAVATDPAVQPKEDAQTKALREQLARETAARKAEAAALIAADIARHPDGANAQAARKAAEEAKAQELAKQSPEDPVKPSAEETAKAAAQEAQARKETAAFQAAAAADRERALAKQKAAVEKWRATGKPVPSIMVSARPDGTYVVMVNGKLSSFATAAEAKAYADKVRSDADTPLSY
jgi:hypothetical protein